MKPKARRLFVAVFPPLEILKTLALRIEGWTAKIPDVRLRWSPAENLHLTLCFLGSVPEERIPELGAALQEVAKLEAIELQLKGLGAFPSHQRPRVLWAGIQGELESLERLGSAVGQECAPFVEKPNNKPFAPHLTLARVKETDGRLSRALRRLAMEYRNDEFGAWRVDQVQLMASQTGPDRSRYDELMAVELGVRS